MGAGVTERSHSAHNESLPGKRTISFTGSRLGRFLCGGRIKCREITRLFFARTRSQADFTLSPFPFAPRPRDASRGGSHWPVNVTFKGFGVRVRLVRRPPMV